MNIKKQIIKTDDLIGKTIVKSCHDNSQSLFLHFKDNSFCIIHDGSYDENDTDIKLYNEPYNQVPKLHNIHNLRDAGFLTEKQFKHYERLFEQEEKNKKDKRRKKVEESEISLLKNLMKKYPNHVKPQ